MSEIEILIQALRIESESERDAFIVNKCHDDPELFASIRNILSMAPELPEVAPKLDDQSLRERIQGVLNDDLQTDFHDQGEATQTIGGASDSSFPNSQNTVEYVPHLDEGTQIAGRYNLQRKIGEGGMELAKASE